MEGVSRASADSSLDRGLIAAAAQAAVAAAEAQEEPGRSITAAMTTLYEGVAGVFPSVFVVEHGRLWLVAQCGYAVVPDGIPVGRGIMGRAARTRTGQIVPDVLTDPDYVEGLPGIRSELSVPLLADDDVVGVLNVEAERALPRDGLALVEPLVAALAPRAHALGAATTLDLAALARCSCTWEVSATRTRSPRSSLRRSRACFPSEPVSSGPGRPARLRSVPRGIRTARVPSR
jgi:putative methionine-R-sulfoxide reductase with GAF domain